MNATAIERADVDGARGWRRWPRSAAPLAAAWSLGYAALGLFWTLGGKGFPFGRAADDSADLTWFPDARPEVGGPLIAVLGLIAAATALAMAGRWGRLPRRGVLAVAWGIPAALLLLVPDYRVLVAVAYAPIFLVGAPFGWPPVSFLVAIPWPVINQFLCMVGAVAWAGAAVAYGRRTGNGAATRARDHSAARQRWGRWAVAVAVVVPCLYALTRWAWALGIPLGISEEFLREGEEEGLWLAGAALATVAVLGAGLTLGLVRPWGETFPRWTPGLTGKRVPPALAIVPASIVSVLVTVAGLMFVRLALTGYWSDLGENWATVGPELLWPIWGVALGVATLAYADRRRGHGSARGSAGVGVATRRGEARPSPAHDGTAVASTNAGPSRAGGTARFTSVAPIALVAEPSVWWSSGMPVGFPDSWVGREGAINGPGPVAWGVLAVLLGAAVALVAPGGGRAGGAAIGCRVPPGAMWAAAALLAGVAVFGDATAPRWPVLVAAGVLAGSSLRRRRHGTAKDRDEAACAR